MKGMAIIYGVGLIFFIIFMSFIHFNMGKLNDSIQDIDTEMKSHVGDTIIVMKDTLLIVDYSIINEVYILSNGKEISKELAK